MLAQLPKSPVAAWIIGVGTACVAIVALRGAATWYGHPFAGVLFTPNGRVSSIGLPTWSGIEQGLRFPDRILTIDGSVVPSAHAGRSLDQSVDSAQRQGLGLVHIRAATATGERELDLRLDHLEPASWWLYAGTMIFTGALYALAAVIAVSSSPRSPLARTFGKFATYAALYFLTFFDSHTTRAMTPIFYTGFACVPFALVGLALRLPDDVPLILQHHWILRMLDVLGLSLALAVVVHYLAGGDVTALGNAFTLLLGCALVAFVLVLAVRYLRSQGTRRQTLRVVFWATASPYMVVGCGVLIASLSARGSTAAFFAIPAMALAPIATAIAFVQHDLWGSRALLSRVTTRLVATGVACAFAVGVGAALASSVGVPFRGALVGAAAGATVSALLVNLVTRAVERTLFPAAAEYKPTIEQLSEDLTSVKDPDEVARAVERTVRRWLPCEKVEFHPSHLLNGTDSAHELEGHQDDLVLPATFGTRSLGSLRVGRKRGDALFTTDDLDLLRTIANQAALALAHAHSYAELERRRQQQAAAWQIERAALVETVAAEIAHEELYPNNYLRSVFRRQPENAALDAEEIDIGCEEVERLERMVSGLRRMMGHRIERRAVAIGDLVARSEILLRDSLRHRVFDVRVPLDAALRCDPDQVTQVLVNLMANAVDATEAGGRIGVEWSDNLQGAELAVWDDGPGFDGDASRLFAPWFTTKVRGTGLGLAITQRIVRAHGWSIDATRSGSITRFLVSIPSADLVGSAPGAGDEHARSRPMIGDPGHEDTDRR